MYASLINEILLLVGNDYLMGRDAKVGMDGCDSGSESHSASHDKADYEERNDMIMQSYLALVPQ